MIFRVPNTGEEWKHYKGVVYRIIDTAYDTRTGNVVVVYRNLDPGAGVKGTVWTRPLDEFLGQVDKPAVWATEDKRCTPMVSAYKGPRFQFTGTTVMP